MDGEAHSESGFSTGGVGGGLNLPPALPNHLSAGLSVRLARQHALRQQPAVAAHSNAFPMGASSREAHGTSASCFSVGSCDKYHYKLH